MLEIVLLYYLCSKKMGPMLRNKGRNPFGYQFLLVFLWFAGEVIGAFLGVFLIGDEDGRLVAYLLALVGAGVGCGIAFVIANSVSGVAEQRGFAVMPAPGQPPMMGPPGYGPPPGYGQPPGYNPQPPGYNPPPPGGPPSYR